MLTVAGLVAHPELRLEVVAGRAGLSREIDAAAVSELVDPGPWLQGGELLLTIGLLMSLPDCTRYVRGLDAAGVQALVIGLGAELRFQEVPAELVAAADEAGMPLLAVRDGVPFIAVTKAVFAHHAAEERRALEWALRTQRALTAAAVSPGGQAGILTAHASATGRRGVVVDLLGRPIAGTGVAVEEFAGLLAQVRAQGLLGAAAEVAADRRREVRPLGSRRLRAWLLLDGPAASSHQVTGDLVSLLSLELERQHGLGAAGRRERGAVLARLARGAVDDLLAIRWLATVGLPDTDLQAAVLAPGTGAGDGPGATASGVGSPSAPRESVDELAADLAAALPDALVGVADGRVELAAPHRIDLPAALATLAPRHAAGIGIGVRPGALAVSLRQARSALPESRLAGRHVLAADIASSRLLLSTVPADRLQAFADAVLGHVDAAPRADELHRALAAFLEQNGSWEHTAAALKVHRHTVRARIAAIEKLTGRRLATAQDRQELWLALRARDVARMSAPQR